MTHKQIDFFADLVNPLLTVVFLALPFILRVAKAWLWCVRGALALLLVEAIAQLSRGFHVGQALEHFVRKSHLVGKFPSTHCAWAFCMLTGIALLRPKWWPGLVAFGAFYGWLNVYQGYHAPLDVIGALFAVPVTLALFVPLQGVKARRA